MLNRDYYTYRVTWSEEDNEYVGQCLEFPSLSWLASTPEDALIGVRQLVAEVVSDLETTGEPVPEPLSTRPFSGPLKRPQICFALQKVLAQRHREAPPQQKTWLEGLGSRLKTMIGRT